MNDTTTTTATASTTCPWCEGPELLEVLELWIEDRAFMLETCCEASHAEWVAEMSLWGRDEWRRFMADSAGVEVRSVEPEHGRDGGGAFVLDYGLELVGSTTAADKRARQKRGECVREVTRDEARQFVRDHHRHSPKPPAGWRWGHAIWNGPELIAVAMVGRPVARLTDAAKVVEVTRLCVRSGLASNVAWNACSMLYGAAGREAKRRGFERVQTFTIAGEESGTSLKAAGWIIDRVNRGGSWSRKGRARSTGNSTAAKARWVRPLTKRGRRELAADLLTD